MLNYVSLTQDDNDLVLFLAASGGCSLDSSPGKNWVERSGGLPDYICKVAKGVMRSGKAKGQSIAIAISRIKVWAAGGDEVEADTQAKAVSALGQWEALKARNRAKKLTLSHRLDGAQHFMFSNVSVFSTEVVRRAFEEQERLRVRMAQAAQGEAEPGGAYSGMEEPEYFYIKEMWTSYLIVCNSYGPAAEHARIDYVVDTFDRVTFSEPVPIQQVWVEKEDSDDLSDNERMLLDDMLEAPRTSSVMLTAAQRVTDLARTLRT